MNNRVAQHGFSAIELLITMLIASMFLFSGYQLYSQVTRDGADANRVSVLSNKVNERLRLLVDDVSVVCTTTRAPQTINETNGIGSVTYTTSISCPNTSVPTMKLIRVQASYDNGKIVQHAAYSN